MEISAYERIGGEAGLRLIIDDFVTRVFADVMIGFFFRDVPHKRIAEFEFQHAASFLGGPVEYKGRPLGLAHQKHPILGGHFARRTQILRQTLQAHAVPEDIARAWLDHTESLRPEITRQPGGQCID
ncbi:MAG TPA: group 1 truncated hemoglobin [Polyangiales bacterium]